MFLKANLVNANLQNAIFHFAFFLAADLSYANLSEADLSYAIFNKTTERFEILEDAKGGNETLISSANLSNAKLNGAILYKTNLEEVILFKANFTGANLSKTNFMQANLKEANLSNSNLKSANLRRANLTRADLTHADLNGAELTHANFLDADLSYANLTHADLTGASLIETKVEGAILKEAKIYGTSAWNLKGDLASEKDLIITHADEPVLMVDNIKVAQFIYMILNNQIIRDVINTVAEKGVLILGRFKEERKEVLDALKNNLRNKGYLPMLFDFEPSEKRNLTETVQLLANMSKFIIADLTEAKSIPQELSHIIPNFPSIPVVPILLESEQEYAMFEHWNGFNSVLKPIALYKNSSHLIENIDDFILNPVDAWMLEKNKANLLEKKNEAQAKEIEELKAQLQKLNNSLSN